MRQAEPDASLLVPYPTDAIKAVIEVITMIEEDREEYVERDYRAIRAVAMSLLAFWMLVIAGCYWWTRTHSQTNEQGIEVSAP